LGAVTDVSRYEEILRQFGDYQPVAHFPLSIPSDAVEPKFLFIPNLLQGGNTLQLRLGLPADDIQTSLEHYRAAAIRAYIGGDTNKHANLPDGLPTTFFLTSDDADHAFPESYEILVLGAHDAGSPGHRWNNGYSYGVAIDQGAFQIVYWYGDW
jgi:hypothetical protein